MALINNKIKFNEEGKLINYPSNLKRYESDDFYPCKGFSFREKIFIENINGNYIIIELEDKKTGDCYPLDATKLTSGDLIYPRDYSDKYAKNKFEITRLAKCKFEDNKWMLDGLEGKVLKPSCYTLK